jgi:hypothetical protein
MRFLLGRHGIRGDLLLMVAGGAAPGRTRRLPREKPQRGLISDRALRKQRLLGRIPPKSATHKRRTMGRSHPI